MSAHLVRREQLQQLFIPVRLSLFDLSLNERISSTASLRGPMRCGRNIDDSGYKDFEISHCSLCQPPFFSQPCLQTHGGGLRDRFGVAHIQLVPISRWGPGQHPQATASTTLTNLGYFHHSLQISGAMSSTSQQGSRPVQTLEASGIGPGEAALERIENRINF